MRTRTRPNIVAPPLCSPQFIKDSWRLYGFFLLEANGDKDKANHDGATLLFIAAHQGQLEVVRLLLEANADKDNAGSLV